METWSFKLRSDCTGQTSDSSVNGESLGEGQQGDKEAGCQPLVSGTGRSQRRQMQNISWAGTCQKGNLQASVVLILRWSKGRRDSIFPQEKWACEHQAGDGLLGPHWLTWAPHPSSLKGAQWLELSWLHPPVLSMFSVSESPPLPHSGHSQEKLYIEYIYILYI